MDPDRTESPSPHEGSRTPNSSGSEVDLARMTHEPKDSFFPYREEKTLQHVKTYFLSFHSFYEYTDSGRGAD